MSREEKRRYWRHLLEEWQGSGESQAAFCQRVGIKLSSFGYWRRRLSVPAEETETGLRRDEGGFIPVRSLSLPGTAEVSIQWGPVCLQVPASALEQVLPILWQTVREAGDAAAFR